VTYGQEPGVSDSVHYVSYDPQGGGSASQCRAAIVTAVRGPADYFPSRVSSGGWVVSLAVLNPAALVFAQDCEQMEDGRREGTWHWPEGTR
jgi:hypothetical protein